MKLNEPEWDIVSENKFYHLHKKRKNKPILFKLNKRNAKIIYRLIRRISNGR